MSSMEIIAEMARGTDHLPKDATVPAVDRELLCGLLLAIAISLAIWTLLITATVFVI